MEQTLKQQNLTRHRLMIAACAAAAVISLLAIQNLFRTYHFVGFDRFFIHVFIIEFLLILFILAAPVINFFYPFPLLILLPLIFSLGSNIIYVVQRLIMEGVGYWLFQHFFSTGLEIMLQFTVTAAFALDLFLPEMRKWATLAAIALLIVLFVADVVDIIRTQHLVDVFFGGLRDFRTYSMYFVSAFRSFVGAAGQFVYYTLFAVYIGTTYKSAYAHNGAPK